MSGGLDLIFGRTPMDGLAPSAGADLVGSPELLRTSMKTFKRCLGERDQLIRCPPWDDQPEHRSQRPKRHQRDQDFGNHPHAPRLRLDSRRDRRPTTWATRGPIRDLMTTFLARNDCHDELPTRAATARRLREVLAAQLAVGRSFCTRSSRDSRVQPLQVSAGRRPPDPHRNGSLLLSSDGLPHLTVDSHT